MRTEQCQHRYHKHYYCQHDYQCSCEVSESEIVKYEIFGSENSTLIPLSISVSRLDNVDAVAAAVDSFMHSYEYYK